MRSSGIILLLEDDDILSEMMTAALRLHNDRWDVRTTASPEAAFLCLRHEAVRMIIAEFVFQDGRENFPFLAMLAGWDPPLPAIVLSDHGAESAPVLAPGSVVLSRPPQMDPLLKAADRLMKVRQDSVLNGIGLDQLLQMLGYDHKSCALAVSSGLQTGYLHVENGEIIHAHMGSHQGRHAVWELLSLPRCVIRISDPTDVRPSMRLNIQNLLLEWCVRKDEMQATGTYH